MLISFEKMVTTYKFYIETTHRYKIDMWNEILIVISF